MAIDKRSAPTWVKVVIVLVAVAFVGGPAIGALLRDNSGGAADGSNATNDAYAQIAQQYAGQTAALEQSLASEPTSYTALVNQGNAYFDWAQAVQSNEQLGPLGADRPIWLAATGYYGRALDVKAGDPQVGTDMAVAYFYGGQTNQAVSTIEGVLKTSPDFTIGYFNAGIFYREAGIDAKATSAWAKYLELEPNKSSEQAKRAQTWLSELKAASATTTATGK